LQTVQQATTSHGQAIGGETIVRAISLKTILDGVDSVDLIDMDIQGAEFKVLHAAEKELDKVKRIHIGFKSKVSPYCFGTSCIGDE
jgi:FkbM family methyltransferase